MTRVIPSSVLVLLLLWTQSLVSVCGLQCSLSTRLSHCEYPPAGSSVAMTHMDGCACQAQVVNETKCPRQLCSHQDDFVPITITNTAIRQLPHGSQDLTFTAPAGQHVPAPPMPDVGVLPFAKSRFATSSTISILNLRV
jgi:hypothetical protein